MHWGGGGGGGGAFCRKAFKAFETRRIAPL